LGEKKSGVMQELSSIARRACYEVNKFYWKPLFWHRAYCVGSVGTVTLKTIQRYVEQQ
jgi:REP-associated tyrosine transposase